MRCWLGIYIYLLILFILLALSIFSYFEDNNHSHHTIKQQIVHKFHIEAVQRKYPVKVGKEESILLSFFPFLLLLLSKCQYSLPHTIKYEQCLNTVLAMELEKFNRFSWCQVFLKYKEKQLLHQRKKSLINQTEKFLRRYWKGSERVDLTMRPA